MTWVLSVLELMSIQILKYLSGLCALSILGEEAGVELGAGELTLTFPAHILIVASQAPCIHLEIVILLKVRGWVNADPSHSSLSRIFSDTNKNGPSDHPDDAALASRKHSHG